ncbi:MAG: sulfite exporter TauE/SafE family protein [Terrimicrobiaceae bacterium]
MESPVFAGLFLDGGSRLVLALTLAVAIGFSLALLGSGGSIITLPVLVYAAGVPPQEAVGMSLAVVGGTSLVASLVNARSGLVHSKAAVLFSVTGIVGAFGGAQLTHLVPGSVLMLLFAGLMLIVATLMLRGRGDLAPDPATHCRWQICASAGLVVGGLTGFLGVGGGFLIVPAMVLFGPLALKPAMATSLVVIAVNSFAGLAGHLHRSSFDWRIGGMFLGVAVAGMLVGRYFAGRLAADHLRRAFAWFVIAVAVFVVAKNWGAFFKPNL